MRCCNLHIPALVTWPEGQEVTECPLCAEQRKAVALANELKRFIEDGGKIKDKRIVEWVANVVPGGQR